MRCLDRDLDVSGVVDVGVFVFFVVIGWCGW